MSSAPVDLCNVPLGTRPDGTWDFVHVQSQEKVGITVCVLLSVLALLVALPRLYVNRRQLHIADYSRYYRHDWNLPVCWFNADYSKLQFCLTFFSTFCQTFPRAAIFLLYRQLFQVPSSRIQIAIWVGLALTVLTNVPDIPIAVYVYRQYVPTDGRSTDFRILGPIQGALAVGLDILAFAIPLPIIQRLNLSPGRNGCCSFFFPRPLSSIVALVYKVRLWTDMHEIMWFQGPVYICAHAEACISIVVGSMPAFSNFMNLYVLQSSAVKGMRAKLRADSKSTTEQGSGGSRRARPLRGTIGSSSERKKRPPYYELTDVGNTMNSRCSAGGGEQKCQGGAAGSDSEDYGCEARSPDWVSEFCR
ncbi:hypothetical protein PG991_014777 [Apiospora marii]|uniref:Integral membrane protein n=1 Tax=Apiospora marii TaxID=335849 RepID=A0ABR1R4M8_9PEZI